MKPKGSQFGPFSHQKRNAIAQPSLPNGIPMTLGTRRGPNSGYEYNGRYEWAPTWEVHTSQSRVVTADLNNKAAGMDYSLREFPEGQEPSGDQGMKAGGAPAADKHPNGYRLADGNHRVTVERHQGAMFHRLYVRGDSPHDLVPVDPVDQESMRNNSPGRYDP